MMRAARPKGDAYALACLSARGKPPVSVSTSPLKRGRRPRARGTTPRQRGAPPSRGQGARYTANATRWPTQCCPRRRCAARHRPL
eukprot:11235526-Alexandrium_andersonii.AAC.1